MAKQLHILTDIGGDAYIHETEFRWGIHKGTMMRDLPKDYITKLYNSKTIGGQLREYLNNNYNDLMKLK